MRDEGHKTRNRDDALLVVFLDAVPSPSTVAAYLGIAGRPEALRFMYFTSTRWQVEIRARPRGPITEQYVLGTVTYLDPVPGFDDAIRRCLGSSVRAIFSHAIAESHRFQDRTKLATRARRCLVPASASRFRRGTGFPVPDRRVLVLPPLYTDLFATWFDDVACDVMIAEMAYRAGARVELLETNVATVALGASGRQQQPDPEALRLAIITAGIVTCTGGLDTVGFIDEGADLAHVRIS
jgi:hypothetical protein